MSDSSIDTDEYYNSTMSEMEEKKKRKMKEQEEMNKMKMNAWMNDETKKTKREVRVESSPVSSRPEQHEQQEDTCQYYDSTMMDSREKKQMTHKRKKKKKKKKTIRELPNESVRLQPQQQQQQQELMETERWRETASPWDVSKPQKRSSEYYNYIMSSDEEEEEKKKKMKREVPPSSVSSHPQHQEQQQQEDHKEAEQWRKRAYELGVSEPKKYMSKTITETDARKDQNRYEICLDEFSEFMPMLELAIKANSKDREVKVNVLDRLGREYTFIFVYIKSNGRYRFRGSDYSKFLDDNRVKAGQKMTVWGLPDATGENYGFAFINK